MRRRITTATPIAVWKGHSSRYHSTLDRRDGVTVRLEGGSYNKIGGPVRRVPHDIVHRIVEHHFALDAGLWGVLAGGGIVQNASFDGGRLPPNAIRRATTMTDRIGEQLRQAEVLVRAVADLSLEGRLDVGPAGGCGFATCRSTCIYLQPEERCRSRAPSIAQTRKYQGFLDVRSGRFVRDLPLLPTTCNIFM